MLSAQLYLNDQKAWQMLTSLPTSVQSLSRFTMGEWYLFVRLLKYRMPTCRDARQRRHNGNLHVSQEALAWRLVYSNAGHPIRLTLLFTRQALALPK